MVWIGLALREDDYASCLRAHTNRFPGMRDLAHKTQSGYYLNKFREYFPDDFDFFPRSFILPQQWAEFEQVFKGKGKDKDKLYIAKPDAGSQGDGIFLVRALKDVNLQKYTIRTLHDIPER